MIDYRDYLWTVLGIIGTLFADGIYIYGMGIISYLPCGNIIDGCIYSFGTLVSGIILLTDVIEPDFIYYTPVVLTFCSH